MDDKSFFLLVCTRVGRYTQRGFTTIEEAAWQADRAKFILNAQGLIGRLSAYNFPERLAAENESAWSVLPPSLAEFLCTHINASKPVTEDEAFQLEEAKRISEINLERQRLIDEATKKLNDEKNEIRRAKLDNLVQRQKDILNEFDKLFLPKSTKERHAITNALGVLCSRLAQL